MENTFVQIYFTTVWNDEKTCNVSGKNIVVNQKILFTLRRFCNFICVTWWQEQYIQCSLNIVFFWKFLNIFRTLPFRFSSVVYKDHTKAGRTPALQQNWQSSAKSQHFKEKTQYLMNTLYIISLCFGIQIFNLDKHAVIMMTMSETILFWSSYCYWLKCEASL